MKKFTTLLAIMLLGALATFISIQYFNLGTPEIFSTPANFDSRFNTERVSAEFDYRTPLLIADKKTGQQYRLEFSPQDDESINYAWNSVTDSSAKGVGKLYEKYDTIKQSPTKIFVKDMGSQLKIDITNLQIEWSRGDRSKGWIYFHPDDVSVTPKNGEQGS